MKKIPIKPTKAHAREIIRLLSFGLVQGMGVQEPGKMCVEAAVCCALGLPHSDRPPCVGTAVRSFKIALNDANWSTDLARAKGMQRLAIAQLGSDSIDQLKFGELLALRMIQRLCPVLFRELKKLAKTDADKADMEGAAVKCEKAENLKDAALALALDRAIALDRALARAVALDLALDLHLDLALARAVALDLAIALDRALARAVALDLAIAIAIAIARDDSLRLVADIAVDVLREMKSPGCKWLTLCD